MVSENRGNGQKTVQRMGAWTCSGLIVKTSEWSESMFASGQILLVPMILGKRTLTEAVTLWKIFLVIVSIVIMVILIRRCGILVTVENKLENKKKKAGAWKIIFGILAAALILLQAWIPYHYQHIDDDDARYVSEEVSAVVHDTLLVDDPITDEYMYWDVGK